MHSMVRCSSPSRTIEEDSTEEIEVDSAKGERVSRVENITLTIGKLTGTILGSLAERGAILTDQAITTT